jgi:hypothetical protein
MDEKAKGQLMQINYTGKYGDKKHYTQNKPNNRKESHRLVISYTSRMPWAPRE